MSLIRLKPRVMSGLRPTPDLHYCVVGSTPLRARTGVHVHQYLQDWAFEGV